MMPHAPRTRLLVALFDLTQASEIIDLYSLAEEAGLNLYRTLSEIHALSLAGFVDAGRLRLTASGLALTVSLVARLRQSADLPALRDEATAAPGRVPARQTQARVPLRLNTSRQQTQGAVGDLFERDLVA